jgi:sugar O-acyltransferase (sialic acid O-acetyltransferase NeuD family)
VTGVLLVAASGLAREALSVIRAAGVLEPIGFLDDNESTWGREFGGLTVLGGLERATEYPDAKLVLCTGKGTSRRTLSRRLTDLGRQDSDYATIIDDSVFVAPGTPIGPGCILLAGSVLTANVTLGRHVVVMPNATVTHDCYVESFATLCAGVALGGNTWVGEGAYLGMNSSVRENTRVGRESVLGMGAALITDLPARETWVGVPARNREVVPL